LPRLGTTRKTFGSTTRARSRSISAFKGKGGKGDHNSFSKTGEPEGLNFQKRTGGKINPYQGRQLKKMIERYWDVEAADKEAGENEATGNNDDEETQ
jgi:hypothetical protein